MAFARVHSAQVSGLTPHIVSVEVDLSGGLHSFIVVGLPDKAVEEARDRVGSAIKNSGFKSPKHSNQKVVVSLAPANIKKEGALFDLPIALGYLKAQGILAATLDDKIFLGELALDGTLRPALGVLLFAQKAKEKGFKEIYVPKENAPEAALIDGLSVFGVKTLNELIDHLSSQSSFSLPREATPTLTDDAFETPDFDLKEIRGQETAKRALEIAAAGGHNVALYGPPGTGKTMLAKALSGILPPLSMEESLEVTGIHSQAGILKKFIVRHPPFRAPHHTSSYVSIIGGGTHPKPGEVTLAHFGVLFLDEFPEFDRRVIESLRQPLEDGSVSISRSKGTDIFPSRFTLIAALNPCPCGNYGTNKTCVCPQGTLLKYQRKISGPIVDRIDIWVHVPSIPHEKLSRAPDGEGSAAVRDRVLSARAIQEKRFANGTTRNAQMKPREIDALASLSSDAKNILVSSAEKMGLSPRAYHRIIKVARTIADLDGSEEIAQEHILEALQYRPQHLFSS